MKIATWNVNSLRLRLDRVLDWLEAHRPDVICLQETKVVDSAFPVNEIGDVGYDAVFHGQASYNGVAILAREEMTAVRKGFIEAPEDPQRRIIACTVEGVRVICVYVPNGQAPGTDKYQYKLEWMRRFRAELDEHHRKDEPLAVLGDYNVAPGPLDVYDVEEMQGRIHFSEPEREALQHLMGFGLTDSFRALEPEKKVFSWWDYRAGSWQKNEGLRIDHILLTAPLLARAKKVWIDVEARAEEKASDHAPVMLELA